MYQYVKPLYGFIMFNSSDVRLDCGNCYYFTSGCCKCPRECIPYPSKVSFCFNFRYINGGEPIQDMIFDFNNYAEDEDTECDCPDCRGDLDD